MRKGISELLSVTILILIVLAVSIVIYINFSKQVVISGRDLDLTANIKFRTTATNSSPLNLLRVELYNIGNIPISKVTIKLNNTIIYDNSSANLEPGSSLKLILQINGTYSIGDTYTVLIQYYSATGDSGNKQYVVEVEPM